MNILDRVPRDAKLRSLMMRATFGERPFCPRCGSSHVVRSEKRYRCPRCRVPFSLTSVSWLKGTKLGLKQVWLLVDCWQRRIAFATAAQIAGASTITVRRWFRRFQEHLVYESPDLRGIVEMDEAFLGRRRHGNQRIVLGAYERASRKVVVRMTRNRDQETTDTFLLDHVDTSSTVCTDSAGCYMGIDAFFGYAHASCDHGAFEFGPTNHIENVWSALKGFIRRTYHHFHKEWLPMLLREFEARWNAPDLFISPLSYLRTCLVAVPTR
jgi:transposase-like protein